MVILDQTLNNCDSVIESHFERGKQLFENQTGLQNLTQQTRQTKRSKITDF